MCVFKGNFAIIPLSGVLLDVVIMVALCNRADHYIFAL